MKSIHVGLVSPVGILAGIGSLMFQMFITFTRLGCLVLKFMLKCRGYYV